jgi:hypothetical protein
VEKVEKVESGKVLNRSFHLLARRSFSEGGQAEGVEVDQR